MELVRDKRVKDAYMNSTIQNMFDRGELRKDHPLQRKPGRWNKSDKDGLIASVIKGEDIDSIKVCEQLTSQGVILWVIDGLQRLTTLNSYRNEVFKLGKNVEMPMISYQAVRTDGEGNVMKDAQDNYIYETVEYDLRGKGYHDLPVRLKEKFDNYKIDVVKHLDCTNEEIGYHIRRYNRQKSMNVSENAVTYMDNIAKDVKKISVSNRFFKDCGNYTEVERNNGTINRIIMESVMCMFHLDQWKKQSKVMGSFLNINSSPQEFALFDKNITRLEKIYSDAFQEIFTSKDSFIWFTLFHKFTALGLKDIRFAEFLLEFKTNLSNKTVNGELFYEIDKGGSTKDKAIIVRKLNLLEYLMLDFLDVRKENAEEIDLMKFVRDHVNPNITKEDLEIYNDIFSDLTVNVDNHSRLLDIRNRPSFIALICDACNQDIDLDDWILDFFRRNETFIQNQTENYFSMKSDLEKYLKP